jgi:t-SNARE complex subunit (syntaxin)
LAFGAAKITSTKALATAAISGGKRIRVLIACFFVLVLVLVLVLENGSLSITPTGS